MGSFRSIEAATRGFPKQFGHYELLARLATGGMGEVFLARHREWREGFEKRVVLKRVLPHLMDQERFVRMFQHEARIAARIHHSNVCQTFELGSAEGVYYMTMEYLEGLPFNQVIKRRKQDGRLADLRMMGRFVMQAAEGLHAAHTLRDEHGELVNVVHRDVCHSNIFITSVGIAKLLDFGVAKARGAMEKTRTGVVKGTYAYSAPEQLRGEQVDARADVFGLGIVAWEAVTGRRLFRRDTDFLVFKAINEEPIPGVLDLRPDVPEQLARVIERALSRDREGRYATARELGLAIGEAIQPLGPPLSSVAVATLFESAFTEELQEQRRLCSLVDGSGEPERETLDDMPRADRFSDASITRPFEPDHVARIVGALPLAADTEELPAMFEQFSEVEDAPDFEVTPVDDGITYSAMTPMPHLRKKKRRHADTVNEAEPTVTVTESDPTITTEDDEPPVEDSSARALTDVDTAESAELYTEAVPPVRERRSRSPVPLLALACAVAVAGVAYVALRDRGPAAEPARASAARGAAEARSLPSLRAEIQPAVVVVTQDAAETVAEAPSDAALAAATVLADGGPGSEPPPFDAGPSAEMPLDAGVAAAAPDAAAPDAAAEPATKRRKRRVTRRAPTRPGFVTLDAKPYGTVWIDGKKVGVTPLVRIELAPGTHDVRAVSSADGAVKRFKIKVLSGKATRKKISW